MCFFFQACADKLKREMTEFGFPPKFPVKEEKEEAKQVTKITKLMWVLWNDWLKGVFV